MKNVSEIKLNSTYVFMAVFCGFIIIGFVFGGRHSFGFLMRTITLDLGWSRETLSIIFGAQALINGMAAPFLGAIADRWGVGRTITVGCLLYASGIYIMTISISPITMFIGAGVFVGIGVSACGLPILVGVISKIAPDNKRSLMIGIVTTGATAGQLLIIPSFQWGIQLFGWHYALLVLSICFFCLLPLGWFLSHISNLLSEAQTKKNNSSQSLSEALIEARSNSGFILLILGFFVCGFQIQFMYTHLPAFIEDGGLTLSFAAKAMVLLSIFNMAGAWTAGFLGDRYRKKYLLAGIYILRAFFITIFTLLPSSESSILIFCACIGFIWLGTVPLTSGIIAQLFGSAFMSTLFGIVYLGHQMGNFMGAWIGGLIFDITGTYHLAWWLSVILSIFAALIHLLLRDQPVERLIKTN